MRHDPNEFSVLHKRASTHSGYDSSRFLQQFFVCNLYDDSLHFRCTLHIGPQYPASIWQRMFPFQRYIQGSFSGMHFSWLRNGQIGTAGYTCK